MCFIISPAYLCIYGLFFFREKILCTFFTSTINPTTVVERTQLEITVNTMRDRKHCDHRDLPPAAKLCGFCRNTTKNGKRKKKQTTHM